MICMSRNSQASERIDAFSGADQSFSAGYQETRFAEDFHLREAYGPLLTEQLSTVDTWQFKKDISVGFTYDSNIFSSRNDPKDDIFYTYSPTLGVRRKGHKSYIENFYTLSYVDYVEDQKLSRPNQKNTTKMEYKTDKLSINVSNVFEPNTAYAIGERTELKAAETSKVITYTDDANMEINYKITPKTSFDFDWNYKIFYFPVSGNSLAANSFSSQTHIFTPGLFYQITPKTSVFAKYGFEIVDFFQGGGFASKAMSTTVGVAGKITPKTGLSASLGYKTRKYNETSLGNFEGYTFRAAVSRRFLPKIAGTVSYSRDTQEDFSIQGSRSTSQEVEFFGLNLTWFLYPHLTLDGGASAGFNSRQGLFTKVDPENSTLTFTRPEETHFYEWNLNLNWHPRPFVEFFIGYKYFNHGGTFKGFQYDDQRLTATGSLRF